MLGNQSPILSTVDGYAQRSRKLIQDSYESTRSHGSWTLAAKTNTTNIFMVIPIRKVILFGYYADTVVDEGQSRKLHHPWKGPDHIVKKILDCDYHNKSLTDQFKQIVWLMLCKSARI